MADRLQVLFLESIWQLGGLVLAGAVVWYAAWRQMQTPGRFRVLIGWLIGGAVLLAIQQLIVTDREKITRVLHTLAEAVDEGDIPKLIEPISESLTGQWQSKEDFAEEARRELERITVDDVKLDSIEVVVTGDTATARFRARARVESESMVWPLSVSRWELGFQRESNDQWRVVRIEPNRGRRILTDS